MAAVLFGAGQLADPAALVEALEVAYTFDHESLELADQLAGAYIAAGDFDRATPLVDDLIERLTGRAHKKERARLQHLRGQIRQGQGDLAGAEQSFNDAYQTDMTYLPNLMSLGKLRYAQGDLTAALKHFQTMLLHQMSLKDPNDRVEIFYHLGRIMQEKGDVRRARDMYTRALSINRNHEPSKKGRAEVE